MPSSLPLPLFLPENEAKAAATAESAKLLADGDASERINGGSFLFLLVGFLTDRLEVMVEEAVNEDMDVCSVRSVLKGGGGGTTATVVGGCRL